VVAVAGTGGVVAYGAAHKTLTLDVDGKVTTVETFQGDVGDLLTDEGVEVGGRDSVTPGLDGALREGGTVVVRYGHKVTLRADGERRTAWVTALDADEALAKLSEGADDVVLVPARADGTVTLPMRLDADGPVNLVAGGETRRVADGDLALDELLATNEVSVDGDDRVVVERADGQGGPTLTVVVKEVQSSIEETSSELPFETVTATDPDHYEDLGPYLATEGAVGKRVTSWDVTTIDGKVVEKEKLNSWVERAPVDKVIMYGTKERPRPEPEPAPQPKSESKPDPKPDPKPGSKPDSKPEPDSKPDSKAESGQQDEKPADDLEREPEAKTMSAPVGDAWSRLAECESGGNPATNTGNGYYGLYQFSQSTWTAMGGSGLPSEASAAEQTMRAQALQQQSGWGQWPACAASLGLR
jgi:uncharacterized protein YabE (DUF348 family)